MTQDELKALVAQAAADYVLANVPQGAVLGVGTGSTANLFIDAMAPHKARFVGAVSSSEASTRRLQGHGFTVLDLNDVDTIPVYVDGADVIDADGIVGDDADGVGQTADEGRRHALGVTDEQPIGAPRPLEQLLDRQQPVLVIEARLVIAAQPGGDGRRHLAGNDDDGFITHQTASGGGVDGKTGRTFYHIRGRPA